MDFLNAGRCLKFGPFVGMIAQKKVAQVNLNN